jgi:topoisomerase IA-like protein
LLEKFISKKGRPFSAYLVRQPDGKIGFEFEAREPKAGGKGARAAASPGALRILGKHPEDDQVISVYSGRYGPYVKHGTTNATIPDKNKAESITLEEAVALIEEKSGGIAKAKPKAKRKPAVAKAKTTTTDEEEAVPTAKKKPAPKAKSTATKARATSAKDKKIA